MIKVIYFLVGWIVSKKRPNSKRNYFQTTNCCCFNWLTCALFLHAECVHEPGHDSWNFMYIGWPAKCTYIYIELATCNLLSVLNYQCLVGFYLEEKTNNKNILLRNPFLAQDPREFDLCAK